jgi:hypothetical protein
VVCPECHLCIPENIGPRADLGGTPDEMCGTLCVVRYVKCTILLDRKIDVAWNVKANNEAFVLYSVESR